MEGETNQKSEGTEQIKQDAQKAQQELKKVAERAKTATAGFSFGKLFQGRLDNINYFYCVIASLVVGMIVNYIPVIGMFASIALAVIGIGATIRRLHDINQSGWFALALVIPPFLIVYLCWKVGTGIANTYGSAPDQKREFFKAILNT